MSENFQSDFRFDENPNGTVSFATDVIATIAGLAVNEVEGVSSMSSQGNGITDMFSRKGQRNYTKGVRIEAIDNKVTVSVSIVVEYGSPIPEVAKNIQENVRKAIETMTGQEVHAINVQVTGISFEREQRAAAELEEQRRIVLEEGTTSTDEEEVEEEKTEECIIEEDTDKEEPDEAEADDEAE